MILGWFGIIGGIVLLIAGISYGIYLLQMREYTLGAGLIVGSLILGLIISAGSGYWLYGTESGRRAQKDFSSETSGGIERIVTVYDVNGKVIKTYEGKFDIESNAESQYILFEDENGKRHTIYYTTGTISVDEK